MKENLFIINPASARGRALRVWDLARRDLIDSGIDFEEHVTSRAGEAAEVTGEAIAQGFRRVIAGGGDGTIGEVAAGYFDENVSPLNAEAMIGLMPGGTASDFHRTLALRSKAAGIPSLLKSPPKSIDAALATFTTKEGSTASRVFINLASLGLGGEVVRLVNGWRSHLPQWIGGRFRYAAAALGALGKYRNVETEIEIDGEKSLRIESFLMAVANGRFAGGGMMFAPHAELDDGLLDVILTHRASRLDILKELPRIRWGGHLNSKKVMELRAREISIVTSRPIAFEIDGEMVGHTPVRIRVLPGAVRFLMG